jgi:RND family efflux transporter, MFP subunit
MNLHLSSNLSRLVILALILSLTACGNKKDEADSEMAKSTYERELNQVDTAYLQRTVFKKQLSSNGKLQAKARGVVGFKQQGIIVEFPVRNGVFVRKGDLIARIDDEAATLALAQAHLRYEKAVIDRRDELIKFGYPMPQDTTLIPHDLLRMSAIRSGYDNARIDLRTAEINLENCRVLAPFSGKVANLKTRLYEQSRADLCTLIDDSSFEVDFAILETEMDFITPNMEIQLSPLHKPSERYKGRVTEINPGVDERGQIRITAVVSGNQSLMDGMNVKVYLESSVPGELVVPKTAVVIRDGFTVLFKYENGKAFWTYIDVVMASSEYYAVTANVAKSAELNAGDCIIVGGNVNLAHGSEVIIRN